MRKLRNIGYLRFGSKIRQGFAAATLSLTPPLSLPLSGCRGKKMRGEGELSPLERAAPVPGGRLPPEAKMRLNVNFIYIEVPTARQEGGRGPAAPLPGGRGTKL